jgi:dihydroorotase
MKDVVGHTGSQFGRAIIMPNLKPPVTDASSAQQYKKRIQAALIGQQSFEPLMTLYLTDRTTPEMIVEAHSTGAAHAVKLYPAGATTNSDSGVTNIAAMDDVFAALADTGMLLLLHGEVTDSAIDIFDREAAFLETVLPSIIRRHPNLKIVLEHITTEKAVDFVEAAAPNVGATITAHHLLANRNHMLAGGIRPHFYCLPILKRDSDRIALLRAATSGNQKFFLGTDSAPHPIEAKESACGCAGSYTAAQAMALYATAFEEADAISRLEGFASLHGPEFYGLPVNTDRLVFERTVQVIPEQYKFGPSTVRPFFAGTSLQWTTHRA